VATTIPATNADKCENILTFLSVCQYVYYKTNLLKCQVLDFLAS
jgi:hypothetical protein